MFPSDNLLFIRGSSLQLSGEFVLSDGTKLSYSVAISLQTKTAQGCVKPNSGGNENSEVQLYGINKIGVADFRKVEQTVCCYEAGEVSHIENVMAKEFKKRETRSLISSETTSETEVENLTDTTTTKRNELQTEVSKVLNEDNSQNYGASSEVHGEYGKSFGFSASGHADFANSSSSSQSNSSAQTYAQEITERALERVVTKTSKKQTSIILKEFEENNQHGFDNRKGDQHVSGVYRWIDIIYKNQLINYGKRLMYEFMVPEPAQFFREAIEITGGNSVEVMEVEEPIHPSEIEGVIDATKLTKNNYLKLASAYGVEVKPIPKEEIYISKGFSFHNDSSDSMADSKEASLVIPKNYKATRYQIDGGASSQHGRGSHTITIANVLVRNQGNDVFGPSGSLAGIVDNISIAVAVDRYYTFSVGVRIKCERTEEALDKWKIETYKTILDGYYEQVEKYNNYLITNGITGNKDKVKFSNSFNRILEKREIKRICINMMVKPYKNPFGQENYEKKQGDLFKTVKQDAAFENHAAHVKFFEQAFEWDIMAYKFYDYFWANQEKWMTLFQESSNADPIFQAFLQSGMARTIVPVRPGFEDAILYYIETGDIWSGGDLVIDQDNDLYISIAEEMQSTEGAVEKEWETRMPTALTMIQKDTVGLQETGLPCCNNVDLKPEEKPIQGLQALIGGNNPIETPKV